MAARGPAGKRPFDFLEGSGAVLSHTAAPDPFNCPKCGAHDWGMNAPHCPHCGYGSAPSAIEPPEDEGDWNMRHVMLDNKTREVIVGFDTLADAKAYYGHAKTFMAATDDTAKGG